MPLSQHSLNMESPLCCQNNPATTRRLVVHTLCHVTETSMRNEKIKVTGMVWITTRIASGKKPMGGSCYGLNFQLYTPKDGGSQKALSEFLLLLTHKHWLALVT